MVIGPSGVQFGLWSYEWLTKLDEREAGVQFANHEYDYRQNWMRRNPVIIAVTISKNNKYI